jgi:hypothetical protein
MNDKGIDLYIPSLLMAGGERLRWGLKFSIPEQFNSHHEWVFLFLLSIDKAGQTKMKTGLPI